MGSSLTVLDAVLYAASARQFASPGQVSGREPAGLVTSGPYCFSRNPQILGLALALGGISLGGRSLQALLLVAAFSVVHQLYLPLEERHLKRTFGEDYRRYRAATPRFLDLPRGG